MAAGPALGRAAFEEGRHGGVGDAVGQGLGLAHRQRGGAVGGQQQRAAEGVEVFGDHRRVEPQLAVVGHQRRHLAEGL
jgi:hypothetical protein